MRLLKKESGIVVQRYSGTWLDIGTWNTLAEVMEHTIGRVTPDENCMNVYAVNTPHADPMQGAEGRCGCSKFGGHPQCR